MNETVADRIKRLRIEQLLSQDDLAKLAGYSDKSAISKFEHAGNEITIKQIKRVAAALGVSGRYLMGWTQDPNPSEQEHDPNETEKALQLYDLYQKAIPEVQKTVSILLKFPFP